MQAATSATRPSAAARRLDSIKFGIGGWLGVIGGKARAPVMEALAFPDKNATSGRQGRLGDFVDEASNHV
ncbi:hypothetical protein [Methylobacterium sp. 37f]|uniref:hypothetical protein n=1 Tax=Methylobacterium sp. 37f TaxID=2817058 RepID=UPI001FFC685F|nr:hypothetical protein [Methylobacterium sp. 37f]MCK2056243.1 hypothetical protein [Methylobacterium sp. 37f]